MNASVKYKRAMPCNGIYIWPFAHSRKIIFDFVEVIWSKRRTYLRTSPVGFTPA